MNEKMNEKSACLRADRQFFAEEALEKGKSASTFVLADFWRRRRDSNPRTAFNDYTISNRARSTSYATSPNKTICDYFVAGADYRNGYIISQTRRLVKGFLHIFARKSFSFPSAESKFGKKRRTASRRPYFV